MKFRHALMLSLLLPVLAACGPKPSTDTTPTGDAPAATAPADTAAPPPADTSAAPVDAATPAAGTAPDAGAAAAANTNPVVPPEGPAPVAGRDYEEIAGGQPYAPLNGQVEVVEVFGYVCPACGAFAPRMAAWKARLPADVRVSYVPVAFGKAWEPYAKAFYAAEAKGLVDKTHDAVFSAIHLQRTLPGEGKPPADPAQLAKFYAGYGANPQEFVALMNSFATNAKMGRGMQFAQRSGVSSTPTLVVNGKYRVTGGSSWDDVLRITDHLIAMERAKR
ncbi:thiol:disulfide interchange protein DsbA/DsbL [Pseudoxanthomonas sp. F37]|uniref:thiol:disulfide interchange protein DsbA/DsbL n=1 Tax=Pseudoxanthomonas TaxID=83618 RepID=UPI001FD1443D|nr:MULTISPECIES: thiol:disulfide interchange protein DsbA/DsbL [Pseudoxanthomonas]UOV03646.1 thiol:disulfide interchange protein DsbA/DsbL [Pseudoxanthomonas mexicana]UOV08642.1 thiol:disulfide interchange protein DsbA/DsbL [Pseudoxanthomonas sp. F37]